MGTVRVEQDSVVHVDSVASHVDVSFAMARTGYFAGHVTAFHALGPGGSSAVPAALVLPLPFSGRIDTKGTVALVPPSPSSECSSPAPAVVLSSRDLWIRVPDTVRVGSTWDDSSTTSLCRDGIPLLSTIRRSYRVEKTEMRGSVLALVVSRDQRSSLDGAGSQRGEPVRISGTGEGRMTLSLAASTGAVLEAAGHSTLTLTFTSARRTQHVQQFVVTSVQPAAKK
ncbi:MAG: hypothetical protein HYR75_00660 [Gemmatimonadetes bacterium]|nr:hypothetical protein [Gemmatimonadota bacterium]MBI3504554.1 hypothetical protein [Pseudomonadota bacterium]